MRLIKQARKAETKAMGGGKWADLAPFCGVLAILAAPAGLAAEAPKRAPAMQSVLDCRAIQDGVQRLACFDKAVGEMASAEQSGDLISMSREQRRTVRRQAFGLTLPALSMFDRGEKPDDASRLDVTLARVNHTGAGKWVFVLDDGAVWRQIDDTELEPPPRPGEKAVIRRASLGSYMIQLQGSAIRVHRDN
jgi:hypothetical protein